MTPALLVAVFHLGAFPPVDTPHAWQVEYDDQVLEEFTSPSYDISFEERPFHGWRSRYIRLSDGIWSEWSRWYPFVPYPGDCGGSLDGVVGGEDYGQILQHWEETAP